MKAFYVKEHSLLLKCTALTKLPKYIIYVVLELDDSINELSLTELEITAN